MAEITKDRKHLIGIIEEYIHDLQADRDNLEHIKSTLEQNIELSPAQLDFLKDFIGAQ